MKNIFMINQTFFSLLMLKQLGFAQISIFGTP
jgi:hypothetical protein